MRRNVAAPLLGCVAGGRVYGKPPTAFAHALGHDLESVLLLLKSKKSSAKSETGAVFMESPSVLRACIGTLNPLVLVLVLVLDGGCFRGRGGAGRRGRNGGS